MANDLAIIGNDDEVNLILPANLSEADWARLGQQLGRLERASNRVGWWIGDWWNTGSRYTNRRAIVMSESWMGPSYATCRDYGTIAAKFPLSDRFDTLSFSHHMALKALKPEIAHTMLLEAATQFQQTGEMPTVRSLRQDAKRLRRRDRERDMAEATEAASLKIGHRLYGVIYADPPWRFTPYSNETGMDRSAENHYETMATVDICGLADRIPAARDCALFLWATVPMLPDAMEVMEKWGFAYRTHWVWLKNHAGMGYWNRNMHEILLLGIAGDIPAPAPGDQFESVLQADVGRHSEKPAIFSELIEEMFPNAAHLEMFARSARPGWSSWGNETIINELV